MSRNWFEIGGELFECDVNDQINRGNVSTILDLPDATPQDELFGEVAGYVSSKNKYDIMRASRAPARARRAKTALTIAAALVMVDGPLPFGDAAAAVLLTGYAGYELYTAVGDVVQ